MNMNMRQIGLLLALFAVQIACAEDFYVSTNDVHQIEGSDLGWGTYVADDQVAHNAYTNLQQAINATKANGDVVWVEDGFVCDDTGGVYPDGNNSPYRIKLTRNITVRTRSGKWEKGAVIRGRYHCDVAGGSDKCGASSVRGVCGNGWSSKLIGFRIDRCSMSAHNSGCSAYNIALENCLVCNNNSGYNTMGSVQLKHCVVSNCYASTYGQIFNNGSAYDSLFIKNSGSVLAAYMNSGNVISNCVFTKNANNCACACAANPAKIPLVIDCVFRENTGSAIGSQYGSDMPIVVSNCLFTANTGSIFAPMFGIAQNRRRNWIKAYNCIVTNNTTSGSLIYSCGAFYNCLFAKNTRGDSNCRLITNPEPEMPLALYNCTIYGNNAKNGWGGVSLSDAPILAVNTICRANTSASGYVDSFTATTNCCLETTATAGLAENNTTANPLLINPEADIYTPSELSDCYDGGTLTGCALLPTDLAGRPRLTDGTVAIGAYEYDPQYRTFSFSMTFPKYVHAPATCTMTGVAAGYGFTPVFYWDFEGDGKVDLITDSPFLTKAFDAGNWHIALTVSNVVAGYGSTVWSNPFTVINRPVHYVKEGSENPVPPFLTEETAAADIASAVDYSIDGDEILILKGTYNITSEIKIHKDLIVHGATGRPEDVVIHQTAGDRCLWVNGGDQTIVHSLVLENGARDSTYDYGGGLYLASGDRAKAGSYYTPADGVGIVSNVIVRNCKVSSKFTSDPGICACGPKALVTHCIVSNCTSKASFIDGGKMHGLGLHLKNGARAENCLITANWSGNPYNGTPQNHSLTNGYKDANFQSAVFVEGSSVMRFCTVVGNKCSYCGGVNITGAGRVENCVIAGNKALCNFLKAHSEGDRLNVWSSFPESPDYCFYRGPNATAEQREGCWNSFTNIVAQEIAAASVVAAQMTTNAVDFADNRLGSGTVVGTLKEFLPRAGQGDYYPRSHSPVRDVVPRGTCADMPGGDLGGRPRLSGPGYDLGAFEYTMRGFMILVK